MRHELTNSDDIIDSRDILERFEELKTERDDLADAVEEAEGDEDTEHAQNLFEAWQEDNEAEYTALEKLIEQCEGYGDFAHGETLIREDYFETYAQELADDIGAIDRKAAWPTNHIDWEAAADELRQDYMEVDFAGTTYLMRA